MTTFFIVKNNNDLVYCNGVKLGETSFDRPNKYYNNVIRFETKEKAQTAADGLNKTFGVFLSRKKDKFFVQQVNDYTEDNVKAFEFICNFVTRYLAYDINKDSVDLDAYRVCGDKYYAITLCDGGFKVTRYANSDIIFTLDSAKVLRGNTKNGLPLIPIMKHIKSLYGNLLRRKDFKTILENPKEYTTEEKCKLVFDRFSEKGKMWETGSSLPVIAEFIAKVFGDSVVKINLPYANFNCVGPASKIAWESDRLMPYPKSKEHIEYGDATTMFYGHTPIERGNFLPFLADVSCYHVSKYSFSADGMPIFHLAKGNSWRTFL